MNQTSDILDLISARKAKGEAFALATVVRTVATTAAKAGAKAVILADGTMTEGWIGGGCARAAVLKAAKEALADGQPRLVSVQPPDALQEQGIAAGDERAGVRFANNMCPSRGTLDVFVEPVLPRPQVVICGSSPVAVAIAALAPRIGFSVTVCTPAAERAALTSWTVTSKASRCLPRSRVRATSWSRPRAKATRPRSRRRSPPSPTMWPLSAAPRRPTLAHGAGQTRHRCRQARQAACARRARSRRHHPG